MANLTLSELSNSVSTVQDTDLMYVSVDEGGGIYTSAKITGSNVFGEAKSGTIVFGVDGSGSVVTTGLKQYIVSPYDMEIQEWNLSSDQSGDIEIDIWTTDIPSAPPTALNSITGGNAPSLSSEQFKTSSNLTGWATTVNASNVVAFNINSVSTVTQINMVIKVKKT